MTRLSKKNFQRAVNERMEGLSDEDVFASDAIREIMQAVITTVCRTHGRIPQIITRYEPKSDLTAQTNGDLILLNTMGPLIRELPDRWRKYVCNFGHVTHECGHVLHTDFTAMNPLREGWKGTEFTFSPFRPSDETKAREIERILNDGRHEGMKRLYADAITHMFNILEDVFVENCLYEEFDGLCAAGLHLANAEKYRLSMTEKKVYFLAYEGRILPAHAADVILQIRRLGYPVKPGEPLSAEEERIKQEVEEVLAECEPLFDELAWEYDGKKRAVLYNEIALRFFRLIPDRTDPETEQSGGNGQEGDPRESRSGDGDYSDAEVRRFQANAGQLMSDNGASPEAEGIQPAVGMDIDRERSEENRETASENAESEEALKRWERIADREAAGELIEREEESRQLERLRKEAEDIKKRMTESTLRCAFIRYNVRRPVARNNLRNRREIYDRIFREVSRSSKGLTRRLEQILADRKEEGYESGFLSGQRFNPGDVWRDDYRYFSRAVLPDGVPDAAFALMIDESGSMGGEKSIRARECAILLEDALRNLGVPFLVCGHDANSFGQVNLDIYADFDTVDDLDRYRLTDIGFGGCNCDGGVITYLSERLLERNEAEKVLIVISDGLPSCSSFYDETSNKNDTRMAIEKYRKRGVRIFGAVVDEFENVSGIYGNEFSFDCTEDTALEKNLIRIVKQYVLK